MPDDVKPDVVHDDAEAFFENPTWHRMLKAIAQRIEDEYGACVDAPTMEAKELHRGWLQGMQWIMHDLPKTLKGGGDDSGPSDNPA